MDRELRVKEETEFKDLKVCLEYMVNLGCLEEWEKSVFQVRLFHLLSSNRIGLNIFTRQFHRFDVFNIVS